MTDEKCVKCGNRTFKEGVLKGYANVFPTKKIFSNGSPLIRSFCSECGEVNSMKIQKPEKF